MYLSVRIARFSARFFRAKRVGSARLGPLRAGLRQEIEPAPVPGGPSPKRAGLHQTRAGPSGPFGHLHGHSQCVQLRSRNRNRNTSSHAAP
jgi:hypothetical protein